MPRTRKPAAAGMFYAGTKEDLRKQIESCFEDTKGPGSIPEVSEGPRSLLGLVSPHAGYPYSGPIAAHGFSYLASDGMPSRIVILGPSHSGTGEDVSIDTSDYWSTPLGEVSLDLTFAEEISDESDLIEMDSTAHSSEHSLEVQIPFLQYLFSDEFKIVPICIKRQTRNVSKSLGKTLGKRLDGNTLIIASSDFTHYEPMDIAKSKDREAVELIENMDWEGFLNLVSEKNLSICGYSPIAILLIASQIAGAERTELFNYATSGDTAGSPEQVVGYCSLGVMK